MRSVKRRSVQDKVVETSYADIASVRHVSQGTATPEMQKLALRFIVERLCCVDEVSYAETDRDTCYAEGRRGVGLAIRKLLALPEKAQE